MHREVDDLLQYARFRRRGSKIILTEGSQDKFVKYPRRESETYQSPQLNKRVDASRLQFNQAIQSEALKKHVILTEKKNQVELKRIDVYGKKQVSKQTKEHVIIKTQKETVDFYTAK